MCIRDRIIGIHRMSNNSSNTEEKKEVSDHPPVEPKKGQGGAFLTPPFTKDRHVQYAIATLLEFRGLNSLETNKMMMLYFLVGTMEMLDAWTMCPVSKKDIIEWIYAQQIYSDTNEKIAVNAGFRGGPYLGYQFCASPLDSVASSDNVHDQAHIVNTYSAIAALIMLGDDLKRVRKDQILKSIKSMQCEDGSVKSFKGLQESDVRFVYAACAVCELLDDWSGIDKEQATRFILNCRSYDYAFGLRPGLESHGGGTYCCLASLMLMDKFDVLPNKEQIVDWCARRQIHAVQGRINKVPDSCYSFWVGATLKMLGAEHLFESSLLVDTLMEFQFAKGGFMKLPTSKGPDPVHTLHSLYGLSFQRAFDLKEVDGCLGIPEYMSKRVEHRRKITKTLFMH
eukprot:TRINITY_DN5199_c0_g1_i5.p1 TRINITY_DN5199_c0_g1~~TRINITY_DN5199_c0_g1_i5.p1  ORF type:complete len:396 (+),score=44.93 TRINITY_DN5199_c0_g1_i5:64-1251(+)